MINNNSHNDNNDNNFEMFSCLPNVFRRLNRCRNKRKKSSVVLVLLLLIFVVEEFLVLLSNFADFQVCQKLGPSKADIETAAEYESIDFNVSHFFF